MSIPERYKNARFEDVPKQIAELYESMNETRRGIYIHGPVGTGKTHFAYAIKKKYDYPEAGRFSRFRNMTELLRDMRQDFDLDACDRQADVDGLMDDESLVIIDDVGSEKITEWVAETFYLIVNKRYNAMAPTIFTSNLNPQDLAERVGDRTVSRIVEMCDIVELSGSDKRTAKVSKIKVNL